jgi:hypothetical protein
VVALKGTLVILVPLTQGDGLQPGGVAELEVGILPMVQVSLCRVRIWVFVPPQAVQRATERGGISGHFRHLRVIVAQLIQQRVVLLQHFLVSVHLHAPLGVQRAREAEAVPGDVQLPREHAQRVAVGAGQDAAPRRAGLATPGCRIDYMECYILAVIMWCVD